MRHLTPEEQAQEAEAQRVARQLERAALIARKKKITDALDLVFEGEKLLRGAVLKTPDAQKEDKAAAVALLRAAIEKLKGDES